MKKQPEYIWDDITGTAICKIYDKNGNIFKGTATCHPDDEDMKNQMTGMRIAEARALIKILKHIKNNDIKPRLAALKQLYYSMNKSQKFNEKSYENYMLQRQIQNTTFDLDAINEEIAMIKLELNAYLAGKSQIQANIRKVKND